MRIKCKSVTLALMASFAVAVPLAAPAGAGAVPLTGEEEEMVDGRYGPRPASDPCPGSLRLSTCILHYPARVVIGRP